MLLWHLLYTYCAPDMHLLDTYYTHNVDLVKFSLGGRLLDPRETFLGFA
jgi:hypothetical protein